MRPTPMSLPLTLQWNGSGRDEYMLDDSERRITAISKEIQPEEAQAQSVQLVKFDAEGARRVRCEIARLVDADQKNAYPTSAYGPLIAERSLFAVEVGSAVWGKSIP